MLKVASTFVNVLLDTFTIVEATFRMWVPIDLNPKTYVLLKKSILPSCAEQLGTQEHNFAEVEMCFHKLLTENKISEI